MSIAVTFLASDGTSYVASAPSGTTLMELAVNNMIPGIVAECGGACACATCHVLIPEDWLVHLPDRTANETGMLEFAVGKTSCSRLSCQIELTEKLDGLIAIVPESQF